MSALEALHREAEAVDKLERAVATLRELRDAPAERMSPVDLARLINAADRAIEAARGVELGAKRELGAVLQRGE